MSTVADDVLFVSFSDDELQSVFSIDYMYTGEDSANGFKIAKSYFDSGWILPIHYENLLQVI